MSKKFSVVALIISPFLIFGCVAATANAPTPKAKSPVTVSIQPAAKVVSGESIDFIISASVQFSTEDLNIQVQAPQGMVLNSGSLSWNGSVQRGETKTLTFNASFNDTKNQRLAVKATVQNPNNSRFSARSVVTVNQAVAKTSSTVNAVSKNARTVPRGNGSVIEYALP